MSTIAREEKFFKQLKFLISFHNPKIVALMAARGFDNIALKEGWTLLENAAGWMFNITSSENGILLADNSEMLTKLDQWENVWFDVCDAALSRQFADVHKFIFTNLSKTSGFDIAKKIRILLDRIDILEKDDSGDFENKNEALTLLEKRGLTPKERENARSLLAQVSDNPISEEIIVDPKMVENKKHAEEEMWAWYIDWRKTSKTVVSNEKLRAIMGIDDIIPEEMPKSELENKDKDILTFLE